MEENPQGLERFVARQTRKRHLAAVWARLAGLQPGMVAADIGCGPGILTREYGRIVGPGGMVYGVEQSAALAAWPGEPADNVRFLFQNYDSALNLEQTPDIIFLTDTLHHLGDPPAVLRRVREACAPATRLLVTEYDPDQPGLVGAKPQRRMPKALLLGLVAAAGFRHGGAIDAEDEHYAVIARC